MRKLRDLSKPPIRRSDSHKDVVGVHRDGKKWMARFQYKLQRYSLGNYLTAKAAYLAYLEARAIIRSGRNIKKRLANFLSHEKHGMSHSRTYKCWEGMKSRCLNPRNNAYYLYGERGITVCKRWLSFSNFFQDMGEKPLGFTIERKNNDGNYGPRNCIWATPAEQIKNRRPYSEWRHGNGR